MVDKELFVVGVGASAGGLESLEQMFDAMPDSCGMAFVIVQHLSPDFKSLMRELLSRHTKMAVHRVEDGMQVEVDSLYLIPPNQDMIISDRKLLLTERDYSQSLSLPIDHFFRSLARDVGDRSVSIVLSGTGSDGSRGVQDIHNAGGLVIVQTPDSAKFDGMPGSAIQAQVADAVVTPEEIPKVLQEYLEHKDRDAFHREVSPADSSMGLIFQALQRRHHIDFNHYKPTTIGRRVKRRIEMDHSIEDIDSYAIRLEDDVEELDQLYRDLLIGVTEFFRDVGPFETLRNELLPGLVDQCGADNEFRVWVAACATGEEAYSIAILIDEYLREIKKNMDVKIFATDIHKDSIRKANFGIYPAEALKSMSSERRERYFTEVEDGYQIAPEIRRMVVFAPQNLIKDPPFTRLSLVTCRNFLIYLMPESQNKVISMFHFGLRAGGAMLLGSSESPGDLAGEFEVVHERFRIFRKRRDIRLNTAFPTIGRQTAVNQRVEERAKMARVSAGEKHALHEDLLGRFMPPTILVDENRAVIEIFGGAGKYLSVTDGRLSNNLLDLVDEDLKLAVVGAIQRCAKSGEPVCYESLPVKAAGESELVKLTITPMKDTHSLLLYAISLEPLAGPDGTSLTLLASQTQRLELDDISRSQLGNLEQELRHTKENLQASIEEMETSNEELQATNEELIASNEELQSTNEELHSVNEELFTVNSEYQRKISELTEMTNDYENLLASTEVHTLFLDENLCIRKFTPKIAEVFHLVPHDLGRRIDAFVHSINCERLSEKANEVLRTNEIWEEHVQDIQEQQFLMRVLPYKAKDETIGVVVTLIDISMVVAAQSAVVAERERFERAIRANRDGTWDWPDLTQEKMWWSPACFRILGYEPDDFPALHTQWLSLIHPEDRTKIAETTLPSQDRCFVELHQNFEYRMKHKSGEYRWYCHRAIVDHDENGKAVRMTGSVADIQDRKKAELFANEGIRMRDNFLSMLSHELRNPLGAVLNAIESFEAEQVERSQPCPNEFIVIRRQSRQMARLLDDLLDVARFGRGRIEFRKEVVDLCELANAVIESTNYELKSKQQKLVASISAGPLCVLGDPARLNQAQVNLIVNASKFSDAKQKIRYSIVTDDDAVVISIEDEGVGIPQELQDSIFDLFIQSEETIHRSTDGMGVGLSLAKSIVEAHQGAISVDSPGAGKGSTFRIRLPLTKLPLESPVEPSLKIVPPCRVLLVEDNIDALEMLAKSLRRRGFEIETASDGKIAIDRFRDFKPEVAVVDIGLPELNGYELARTIRADQQWEKTLLVALTGYGQLAEQEEIAQSGFDHHLVKPLQFKQLSEIIHAHAQQLASE